MIFDFALIGSLLLATLSIPIALIIRASIIKHSKNKDQPYSETQNKMSFQIKILTFFLISTFFGRFLFCLFFPEQISRISITNMPSLLVVLFLVLQVIIAAGYLFWAFLLSISKHFKLIGRFHLVTGQIRKITIFLFVDAVISGCLYIVVMDRLLVSGPQLAKSSIGLSTSLIGTVLISLLVLSVFLYWLTQRKRLKLLYYLFFALIGISTSIALFVSFMQSELYFDSSNILLTFTYQQSFYGLILLGFALMAIGSQLLSGIMIRLRSQFINRYFSVNYTMQLNRISIISTSALLISALLPFLIVELLTGTAWLL